MLRIDCPFCGLRDQEEFTAWGDASRAFPALDASHDHWVQTVYYRNNPRGETHEFFQHTLGCRRWLAVTRNNVTHEVLAVKVARERTIVPLRPAVGLVPAQPPAAVAPDALQGAFGEGI